MPAHSSLPSFSPPLPSALPAPAAAAVTATPPGPDPAPPSRHADTPHPAYEPYRRGRTLHLAAAIGGRGPYDPGCCRDLARLAEEGGLDFVTLGPGGGPLAAVVALGEVAAATARIGVVAGVAAGTAADGDIAAAVARLDRASRGRAGWSLELPAAPPRAGRRGRPLVRDEALWAAAGDTVGAVRAICAAGQDSGAPRLPPVAVLDATEPAALRAAARHADLALVRAARPEDAARVRTDLHRLAAEAGRDPGRLPVLADLAVDLGGAEAGPAPGAEFALSADSAGGVLFRGGPVDLAGLVTEWQRQGAVDGFHVRPVEPRRDLERFVNGTAALLQHRGLFRAFHTGSTLRAHLELPRRHGYPRAGGPA